MADAEYKNAFEQELTAFKSRIRTRAKQKIEEQMEELRKEEEAERQLLHPQEPRQLSGQRPAAWKGRVSFLFSV